MVWESLPYKKLPSQSQIRKSSKGYWLTSFSWFTCRDHCSQKGRDCQGHCQLETALTEVALVLKSQGAALYSPSKSCVSTQRVQKVALHTGLSLSGWAGRGLTVASSSKAGQAAFLPGEALPLAWPSRQPHRQGARIGPAPRSLGDLWAGLPSWQGGTTA